MFEEIDPELLKVVERIASLEDEIGLESDFLDATFEAENENIQQSLISANVLPTREVFGNLSIEEQNTREANENRILAM